ncbi:hypothetical protein NPIL_42851 [Nephila pilipes]|uniref:Uncharacterized protein n=1 Tax=Nephila pilipes TaxID=299642 RepID=A0A8X6PKU1_NEPPI|nr:hypothetical protein NPIL_42851 [Nephila pilipes]
MGDEEAHGAVLTVDAELGEEPMLSTSTISMWKRLSDSERKNSGVLSTTQPTAQMMEGVFYARAPKPAYREQLT